MLNELNKQLAGFREQLFRTSLSENYLPGDIRVPISELGEYHRGRGRPQQKEFRTQMSGTAKVSSDNNF